MSDRDRARRAEATLRRIGWYVAAGLGGAVCSFLLIAMGIRAFGPGVLPPVTAEQLLAARRRWEAVAPANYNLEVTVSGRAAAVYAVRVRDGEVREASRNGRTLSQQRTWTTWTVPGIFETLARDQELVARAEAGTLGPGQYPLELRGAFHPQWGFPTRYQRIELRKFATNEEVSWAVTRWEVLDPFAGKEEPDE